MMEKQASEKEAIPGPQEKIALPKENQYQAAARPETRFGSDPQIKDLNGQLREPVGREIIKQIVEKAYLSTGKETATLKLQLKPEFLGKLDLVISLEKGLLHARFLAENPAVANLIETRLPDLRQSLEQQGISWHQVSVSVDSQAGSGEFSQTGPEAQSLPQHDLLPYAGVHEGNSERRENGASTAGLLGLVDYLV
ncbi:MAG: flagellar hook-length control protein FliK [Bacillota bacterium]|jgi:flagellar hook-length control protein FliK|nr:flagellar hook-length control protein FliK [Bacillota bacterium]